MSCSQTPLSPSSQIMLTLAFLTVQDEEDMVSTFSLPIQWKRSYSTARFVLLRGTLSPHKTCFMPADKPSWPLLRKCCFCTDAGYKGSTRHMFVGKKEQLWGLWLGVKNTFRTSINNKEQQLDHQGIVEVLVCLHISSLLALLCNFKGCY